ncbi:MAG: O-antigen ligase family protein [Nitrospiria bacterium]
MTVLFLILLIGFQLVLAVVNPTALIYISLLIGALPVTLAGQGDSMEVLGKMDIHAIRLFGLWFAALLVILGNFERAWKYINLYRFHFIFLIFCCFSLFWAPSFYYGLRMIAKLTAPFLFLLLVMVIISSGHQLKRMEQFILLGGVITVCFAVLSKALNLTPAGLGLTIPATSPAVFSAYLVAIGMLTMASLKFPDNKKNTIFIILFSAAIFAAFTRITIVAMFIGFSVILFLGFRGLIRIFIPFLGIAGFLALFLFNSTFKNRMFFGADKITVSSVMNDPAVLLDHVHGSGRFNAWKYVFKNFFDPSPLIGSGIGTIQHYYYSNSGLGLGAIHSEYIRLLAEVGTLGLFLFVVGMLTYLFRLTRIYLKNPASEAGKYALGAIGGLISYMIFMATDNAFDYVNAFGIYVFSMIAMSEKSRELAQVVSKENLDGYMLSHDQRILFTSAEKAGKVRRYPMIEIR